MQYNTVLTVIVRLCDVVAWRDAR